MSPLKVQNLVKNYENVQALRSVTLEQKPGEILGLLGPNGAGKTTLISILTTLETATSGQAEVFGYDVQKSPREAKKRIGLVPQELVSHGFFDLVEVLTFISGYHGMRNNRERIDWLLKRLGLWEHRSKKVAQLSGGMKRRFLIAKALVHNPQLLLLDEPTAGVDIELRNTLWEFVRELHAQGTSVLLTTHYLEEAEKLCDRVAIIDKGEIKKVGPTQELIAGLTTREVALTLSNADYKCTSQYLKSQKDNRAVFELPSQMVVGQLLNELKISPSDIVDIKVQEGRLEDAFLKVLGGQK